MRRIVTAGAAALAIAASSLSITTPAEARGWYGGGGYHGGWGRGGGYYRGGWGYRGGGAGLALGAGIAGLAVGAALANSHPYYNYAPAYYAPPPPVVYGYAPGYCRSDWRWDGYVGRYVRVRYCY